MQAQFLHTVLNKDPEGVCSWYGLTECNPENINETEKSGFSLVFKVTSRLCRLERSKSPSLTCDLRMITDLLEKNLYLCLLQHSQSETVQVKFLLVPYGCKVEGKLTPKNCDLISLKKIGYCTDNSDFLGIFSFVSLPPRFC